MQNQFSLLEETKERVKDGVKKVFDIPLKKKEEFLQRMAYLEGEREEILNEERILFPIRKKNKEYKKVWDKLQLLNKVKWDFVHGHRSKTNCCQCRYCKDVFSFVS